MTLLGQLAALFTSLCFSITAIIFTRAGQQVGSQVVNRVRVGLALIFLLAINWILYGQPLPFNAEPSRWFWFTVSGAIGLALGDAFLFQAYLCIGPRLGMLLMSLSPLIGAAIAWFAFGETLNLVQIFGIALTLAGISWVIMKRGKTTEEKFCNPRRGVVFGIAAATGQAVGLVLSKQGLTGDFPAIAGNVVRMASATLILWTVAAAQGQAGGTFRLLRKHPAAQRLLILGAFIGPVVGVSASLFAVQYTHIGVASTLMALPPVILLPLSNIFFKERVGWQAVTGTLVAIAGVAILFMS